ncbi:methionyl-tRNA formyltransferase [Proteiniclasticum ruminis]|uniref:methionyl-tRNA formyltransferase n=1 Tax=Proteiniclasticum ruminis TaxID=398199 RepID=UPI0028A59C73|nr:methionyl-tRNA formyltransferase [Proteiniclasticum ruminis]
MMKIIFMGTPDFSVPSLKTLDERYGVSLVVTQPDKEKGRGKKVTFPPVKEEAVKRNIPVRQPVKLRNDRALIEEMKSIAPDFIIVVAYGQILSEEILAIPKYGCINLHASLLPKLRGAAPLNFALIEGHKESGATTMLMNKGLDTGDMLLVRKVDLSEKMNVEELHDRISEMGGDLLVETVEGLLSGFVKPQPQKHEESTYAPLITKDLQLIQWDKPSVAVHNLVRGLSPVPGAFSYVDGQKVKILETEVMEGAEGAPGEILKVSKEGIIVATGEGQIRIVRLQYPGKKPMNVRDFLNGNTISEKYFKRSED